MDIHIDNVPYIITACCVLHNMCEVHGDTFNEEWLQDNISTDTDETYDHHHSSSSSSSRHEVFVILNETFDYIH